jgi:hypothetical protein
MMMDVSKQFRIPPAGSAFQLCNCIILQYCSLSLQTELELVIELIELMQILD